MPTRLKNEPSSWKVNQLTNRGLSQILNLNEPEPWLVISELHTLAPTYNYRSKPDDFTINSMKLIQFNKYGLKCKRLNSIMSIRKESQRRYAGITVSGISNLYQLGTHQVNTKSCVWFIISIPFCYKWKHPLKSSKSSSSKSASAPRPFSKCVYHLI